MGCSLDDTHNWHAARMAAAPADDDNASSPYWVVYSHLITQPAKPPWLVFVIPGVWRAEVTHYEDMMLCATQQVCLSPDWDAMQLGGVMPGRSPAAPPGAPVSSMFCLTPSNGYAGVLRGMATAVLRHLRWSVPRHAWLRAVARCGS